MKIFQSGPSAATPRQGMGICLICRQKPSFRLTIRLSVVTVPEDRCWRSAFRSDSGWSDRGVRQSRSQGWIPMGMTAVETRLFVPRRASLSGTPLVARSVIGRRWARSERLHRNGALSAPLSYSFRDESAVLLRSGPLFASLTVSSPAGLHADKEENHGT